MGPTLDRIYSRMPGVTVRAHYESETGNGQVMATKDSAEGEEVEFLTGITLGPNIATRVICHEANFCF